MATIQEIEEFARQCHAERHPGEVYLMDSMPAKLKKQVMETLMSVNNIHFAAKLWSFIKAFEMPTPKSRGEAAEAAATNPNIDVGKKQRQRKHRTNRGQKGRKGDTE